MDRDEANRLLKRLKEAEQKLLTALADVRAAQDDLVSMVDYDGDVTGARIVDMPAAFAGGGWRFDSSCGEWGTWVRKP